MGRLLLCAILALPVWAADDINPDEIIRKFAAKETAFQKARENYTYRQTVKIQELDYDGNPHGKYEMVSDIVFGPDGKRTERVIRAPMTTLQNITLTPEDEKDLREIQPFVLNTKDIGKYDVKYVGKQKLDEINCFQFSVHPKAMVKGERYFEGDIWVDDRDLQIVKTFGKAVGVRKKNDDNQFPKFETYREQVDGKYWFPTYTHADDTLHFRNLNQRISMTVKYEQYKQFKSDVNITFGDEVKDKDKDKDK
jgi:hypothetical protein